MTQPSLCECDQQANDLLAARLAYLQITEADCGRVRVLAPLFRRHAEAFIEQFYSHLLAFPTTAAFLGDAELVKRLKGLQMRYFESLLRAELGPDYFQERQRIGQAHAAVGLEPQWFLGAFSQYIQHCLGYLEGQPPEKLAEYAAGVQSLLKFVVLDIGLTLDAYWHYSTDQLRHALDLYTKANTELREFAHLVSHDLKTPLATVSALCEEFLDEFGSSSPAEAVQLIKSARARTLHLKGMIDDLLTASETAAQPSQRCFVSTRTLLDEVLGRVKLEIGDRPIQIDVSDELPIVHAHPARLAEVFYHLLSNAAKFADKVPGLIQVTVSTTPAEYVICVADNGPGIAEADLGRIFAPFHRLPQHRHLPGSGLGLYFVRKMVEEHAGRVWVESKLGEGTRFCIALPREPQPKKQEPA